MHRCVLLIASLLCLASAPAASRGNDGVRYPRPYTGLDASWEAFHREEARRRGNAQNQVALIEEILARNSYPADVYYYPLGVHWSWYDQVWRNGWAPASVGPYQYARQRWLRYPPAYGLLGRSPLLQFRQRQSLGQRQVQTGPNRWESHPIYPETAPLGPTSPALPPAAAPPAAEPARPTTAPPAPVRSNPRAF